MDSQQQQQQMFLTKVEVYPYTLIEGIYVAHASIQLNGLIQINGIRIRKTEVGYRIAWAKDPIAQEHTHVRICHPIDTEFSNMIERAILDKFLRLMDNEEIQYLKADIARIDALVEDAKAQNRMVLVETLHVAVSRIEAEIDQRSN